jgi:uncharacterized protein
MQVRKCGTSYVIRLAIGEEVIATLSDFVRRKKIKSGRLQGLGAVDHATLGIYHLKPRQYEKREFIKTCELVAMMGNIAWLGKDPVLHVHAALADDKLRVFGGHLFSARVAVTVEVVIVPGPVRLSRARDEATGLNLLQL